jgi:plastocyanin
VTPAWRVGAAIALAVMAAAGACVETGQAAKPITHRVTIDSTSYTPARLTVHVGDTIEWVNKDVIPHTATAKAGSFDSKVLATGATFRYTVKAKGATDYACLFHPTMTGRIDAE